MPARGTAFHSLYLGDTTQQLDQPDADDEPDEPVRSPAVLTGAQRAAVVESPTAAMAVISGAPGTGKSHTLVAVATDALARGDSVLVAAKDDAAVDALLTLAKRAPGPDPVIFGSTDRREALADRLAAGQAPPLSNDRLRQAVDASTDAWRARSRLQESIRDQLRAAASDDLLDLAVASVARQAAGVVAPGADLAGLESLLGDVRSMSGRRQRRARGRRERELRRLAEAPDCSLDDLEEALRVARRQRRRLALDADGGLEIGGWWETLERLDRSAREATSQWLAADGRSLNRLKGTFPAVAALATALRAGRAARRQMLGSRPRAGWWLGTWPRQTRRRRHPSRVARSRHGRPKWPTTCEPQALR